MRFPFANLRYKLLALVLALFLWVVAQGSSPIELGFDVPVVLNGIPEELVVTDESVDAIHLRVKGTRAVLRNLSPTKLEYPLDVSGAKVGVSEYVVDASHLDLPRGAEPVSRSPMEIQVSFEKRATQAVRVRPNIQGEPAEGFVVTGVGIEPARIQITGARSEVLRLSEVMTEPIDVTGAEEALDRDVRVALAGDHVWMKGTKPVRVHVEIEQNPEARGGAPEPREEKSKR
jgi:YbbR domain-containing protein